MKTVKLKDVSKKGWRLSAADRLNISSIENSKQVSASMEKIAEVLDKLTTHMDLRVETMGNNPPSQAPAPNVEVIVPPAKQEKRNFRVTPVRGEDGRIEYVDIKQL